MKSFFQRQQNRVTGSNAPPTTSPPPTNGGGSSGFHSSLPFGTPSNGMLAGSSAVSPISGPASGNGGTESSASRGESLSTRGKPMSASSTVSSRVSNASATSAGYELPSEQAVLDEMMEEIIEAMGLGEAQRKQIREMSFENKLKLVQSSQFRQMNSEKSGRDASKDRTTPEYYVKKLAESDLKGIPLKTWTALRVSLTTQPIGWVRHFIDLRGTQLVWDKLSIINSRQHRRENDVQVEIEMVRCLKALLNNKVSDNSCSINTS
jgi:cytokinesis protein